MSLDLPVAADLESLEDPAARILLSCERAKTWLLEALHGNDIEQIVELKSQAEAIRVYTISKQLGHDAELSATEIVRRAERCIGLAIRKGQEEGRIAKVGEVKRNLCNGGDVHIADIQTTAEATGLTRTQISHEAYPLTDGIPDDTFEKALSVAKEERNLSRANVVRKVKGEPKKVDRWEQVAKLAAEGNSSHQIARIVGWTAEYVRRSAAERGISIHADKIVGKTRLMNQERVLRDFVDTIESLLPSCDLIDASAVAPDVLRECLAVLVGAMKTLRKFERRLAKGGS